MDSDSENEVFAIKLEGRYDLASLGAISVGGNFSGVNIRGEQNSPGDFISNNLFKNKEFKKAGYLEYQLSLKKYSINAGVRYELVEAKMLE